MGAKKKNKRTDTKDKLDGRVFFKKINYFERIQKKKENAEAFSIMAW